uniref:Uncharacterized protein n=1 Tax=Magallana gigas TaxID=29159 RepID=K1QQ77_MAGGI
MPNIKQKVALITGACGGIGKGIALHFAALGAQLSLNGKDREELVRVASLCQQQGAKEEQILVQDGDLTSAEFRKELLRNTIEKFKRLDVLVNNAGIMHYAKTTDTTGEHYDSLMDTNAKCHFFLTKDAIPHLKESEDEVECIWNYWVDTLGDPKCNNVTGPQADNACSYCCDNTNGNLPCNRNTIPTQLSTFQNSQKVEQCMTGSSISQYKLETCSYVASYCLNTVRYDTTAKHPEVYVEKMCAYEAECKGQWWEKTRNRPECLSQNFTGIADNNVICTYCCVSDGSGPCNGASVPEQIAHFGPVTTASTQTTATILSTTAHGHGHHNTHVQTDHGHHHTVTTTQTTTENTTTTPATIVCSGNTSIVCEDDPLAHCATLLSVGFCQKLQYNPDGEDVKFCPKTCNLCDKCKPCPFCDANINCVWNQTCADSETCMVRAVLESGFQFSVHCTLSITKIKCPLEFNLQILYKESQGRHAFFKIIPQTFSVITAIDVLGFDEWLNLLAVILL